MLPAAIGFIVLGCGLLFAARTRSNLKLPALLCIVFGFVLSLISAFASLDPAGQSMRAYHDMHRQREATQGQMLSHTLVNEAMPIKQAVYFHNRLAMFPDAQLRGLQQGAGDSFTLSTFHGGSKDLDPDVHVSGYEFGFGDIRSVFDTYPEADLLIFDGLPPDRTGAFLSNRTPPVRWAVLSAPEGFAIDTETNKGLILASSNLPPPQRGSVRRQKISGNFKTAFEAEFSLVRP